MQERFAGRVTLTWNVADDALDAAIPAMLLQPLLENAFKHGVERSSEPVAIRIEARRKGDDLRVDDPQHRHARWPRTAPGIGLRNCRERLAAPVRRRGASSR